MMPTFEFILNGIRVLGVVVGLISAYIVVIVFENGE